MINAIKCPYLPFPFTYQCDQIINSILNVCPKTYKICHSVGSKFCQKQYKPCKIGPKLLKLCQSGEISANHCHTFYLPTNCIRDRRVIKRACEPSLAPCPKPSTLLQWWSRRKVLWRLPELVRPTLTTAQTSSLGLINDV